MEKAIRLPISADRVLEFATGSDAALDSTIKINHYWMTGSLCEPEEWNTITFPANISNFKVFLQEVIEKEVLIFVGLVSGEWIRVAFTVKRLQPSRSTSPETNFFTMNNFCSQVRALNYCDGVCAQIESFSERIVSQDIRNDVGACATGRNQLWLIRDPFERTLRNSVVRTEVNLNLHEFNDCIRGVALLGLKDLRSFLALLSTRSLYDLDYLQEVDNLESTKAVLIATSNGFLYCCVLPIPVSNVDYSDNTNFLASFPLHHFTCGILGLEMIIDGYSKLSTLKIVLENNSAPTFSWLCVDDKFTAHTKRSDLKNSKCGAVANLHDEVGCSVQTNCDELKNSKSNTILRLCAERAANEVENIQFAAVLFGLILELLNRDWFHTPKHDGLLEQQRNNCCLQKKPSKSAVNFTRCLSTSRSFRAVAVNRKRVHNEAICINFEDSHTINKKHMDKILIDDSDFLDVRPIIIFPLFLTDSLQLMKLRETIVDHTMGHLVREQKHFIPPRSELDDCNGFMSKVIPFPIMNSIDGSLQCQKIRNCTSRRKRYIYKSHGKKETENTMVNSIVSGGGSKLNDDSIVLYFLPISLQKVSTRFFFICFIILLSLHSVVDFLKGFCKMQLSVQLVSNGGFITIIRES